MSKSKPKLVPGWKISLDGKRTRTLVNTEYATPMIEREGQKLVNIEIKVHPSFYGWMQSEEAKQQAASLPACLMPY